MSEIYAIEDCTYYDTLTSDKNHFTLTGGTATISYSSDGLSFKGTQQAGMFYTFNGTPPLNCIVEVDVQSWVYGIYDGSASIFINHSSLGSDRSTTTTYSNNADYSGVNDYHNRGNTGANNPPFHLKVVVDNGTATYYIDGTSIGSESSGNADFGIMGHYNRGVILKNLKIKPL